MHVGSDPADQLLNALNLSQLLRRSSPKTLTHSYLGTLGPEQAQAAPAETV